MAYRLRGREGLCSPGFSNLMITVQEHLSRIVETVQRLPPIDLDLLDAQGCVLAQDVTSEVALPGFRNSAMDGYAVHASDLLTASGNVVNHGQRERCREAGSQKIGGVHGIPIHGRVPKTRQGDLAGDVLGQDAALRIEKVEIDRRQPLHGLDDTREVLLDGDHEVGESWAAESLSATKPVSHEEKSEPSSRWSTASRTTALR